MNLPTLTPATEAEAHCINFGIWWALAMNANERADEATGEERDRLLKFAAENVARAEKSIVEYETAVARERIEWQAIGQEMAV